MTALGRQLFVVGDRPSLPLPIVHCRPTSEELAKLANMQNWAEKRGDKVAQAGKNAVPAWK
jgi:hypothetical protein